MSSRSSTQHGYERGGHTEAANERAKITQKQQLLPLLRLYHLGVLLPCCCCQCWRIVWEKGTEEVREAPIIQQLTRQDGAEHIVQLLNVHTPMFVLLL